MYHQDQNGNKKCCHWAGGKFPTFSFILLLVGIFWLLNDMGILVVNIPWFPIILIAFAISGMLKARG